MKSFMFASIGLLCLSLSALIGFHIGHRTAQANTASVYGIVAYDSGRILDVNGEVWNLGNSGLPSYCWQRYPASDLPSYINVSEVIYWSGGHAIMQDGTGWKRTEPGVWENCGRWPGSPVPTDNSSWGAIKEQLNTKGD